MVYVGRLIFLHFIALRFIETSMFYLAPFLHMGVGSEGQEEEGRGPPGFLYMILIK